MADLFSLQKDFLASYEGKASFEEFLRVNGTSPQNRLAVYYGNMNVSLRKILESVYPLIWKLIGEDCAREAAQAFISEKKALPTEGSLIEWGGAFPDFLERSPLAQSLPYLPDFSRLEWSHHLAACAEDKVPLTAHDFTSMNPERYAQLVLKLHPSAYLLSSAYPLDQVMSVIKGEVDSIELENRQTRALIIRPSQTVTIHWLTEAQFSFLSGVQRGYPLLQVLEEMGGEDIQLYEILSFSLKNGLFSEVAFALS